MALFIADGFDTYRAGVTTDPTTYGQWTSISSPASTTYATTPTRFNTGLSLKCGRSGNSDNFVKSGFTSTDTVYFSASLYYAAAANYTEVDWYQGGTVQVRIRFDYASGNILVYRGPATTLLGTYTAGMANSTWYHFQVKVVLNASTGEVRIRKNGSTSDDFALTGQNTRNTANAWSDGIVVTCAGDSTYIDDILVFDSSGTSFNTWTGDVRCYTLLPNGAGSASNFSNNYPHQLVNPGGTSSTTINAGDVRLTPFIALQTMTISKFILPYAAAISGGANDTNMALYADTGGLPSTFIAGTSTVNNPQVATYDYTFSSPPSIVRGTTYWIALQANWAATIYPFASGSGRTQTVYGAPGWLGTMNTTSGGSGFMVSVAGSAANGDFVSQNVLDLDTGYAYGSTVGADDLYAMDNLPATPANILGVQQRIIARKTDAGTRALQTELKSGATTVQGTGTALGTSYAPLITLYPTDPNTSATWTASAINALEAGFKISE
jgi:hypothetical protein